MTLNTKSTDQTRQTEPDPLLGLGPGRQLHVARVQVDPAFPSQVVVIGLERKALVDQRNTALDVDSQHAALIPGALLLLL